MNELEASYFVQQYPTFVAIFVLMVVVIAVLSSVVIIQTRKQQLRPKYGFLGKPLAFLFFAVLAVGSISLVYYSTKTSQDVGTVSADRELNLVIKDQKIESNVYRLSILPSINQDTWGSTEKFNVYWTISNTESFTRVELDLSESNQGGIIVELKSGKNLIKAVVFTEEMSKEITKEIIL